MTVLAANKRGERVTAGLGEREGIRNTMNVEGVNFCRAVEVKGTPQDFTRTVEVTDGRLTLNSGDSTGNNTTIAYVLIVRT
jgi:hypothetical protein